MNIKNSPNDKDAKNKGDSISNSLIIFLKIDLIKFNHQSF